MNVLVDNDLLSSPVVAQSKDAVYLWSFDSQVWYMVGSETFYTIVDTDWFTISNIGWFQGAYIETEKDVLLLFKMNSKLIKELQQDIFTNKGLTSFVFSSSSVVTRIHAHVYYNNELSRIVFPETFNRIDL